MFICVHLWFHSYSVPSVAKLKMELEFDKEIDAILRKARSGSGLSVMTANADHLDADTIAAFAENALPDKSKQLYVKRFADCDRCRKLLSHTIRMNTEAVTSDQGAASSVSAPSAETGIPWIQSIFRTPNLALTMGALVLAFSGILGYLVVQNRNESSNSIVSQVTEQEPARSGPYFGGEDGAANSIASANTATSTAANAQASNAAPAMPASPANTASNSLAKETAPGGTATGADNKGFVLDGITADSTKTASDKPPPPIAEPKPAEERNERKAETEKLKDNTDTTLAGRRQDMDDSRSRDAAPAPKKSGGPLRSSGPVQNQSNQVNTNIAEMSVTRLVGGKRFENRNGAWYDSAYRGQGTNNVRRGTDAYKKLDGGLRNIADTLGGTIVVVWKEKAYRIQ